MSQYISKNYSTREPDKGTQSEINSGSLNVVAVEDCFEDDDVVVKCRKTLSGPSIKPKKFDFSKPLLSWHRKKTTDLCRKFFNDHNWKDCAAALSIVLKSSPVGMRSYPLTEFRKNFLTAIELLNRCEDMENNIPQVKKICELWMDSIKWASNCKKERESIQLELAILLLTQGHFREAHHITKYLIQNHNSATNDPNVNLIHGLTSYQIWYSELPVEMQLTDLNMHVSLNAPTLTLNNNAFPLKDSIEHSDSHHTTRNQEILQIKYESDSSVDFNKRDILRIKKSKMAKMHRKSVMKKILEADMHHEKQSLETKSESFTPEIDVPVPDYSIFDPREQVLDAILLPILLERPSEDIELCILSHKELLTENYTVAVENLRIALYSDPPLLAALLPLIQVLLLGDQVGMALQELKNICLLSNATLPFRLRARLLESFCSKDVVEISNCHEITLTKDPTCSYSLERLIKMFKDGNYSSINLVDMIAIHLDSTMGNENVWDGFASCLFSLQAVRNSRHQQDKLSGNQTVKVPLNNNFFLVLKHSSLESWQLRLKWWLKRHFCKHTYNSEIQAGSWQLITLKASCASHLYGPSFGYVQNVLDSLSKKDDINSRYFLEKHIKWGKSIRWFKQSLPVSTKYSRVDPAWAYAKSVDGLKSTPMCIYCHAVFTGSGITRLKKHLVGGYKEVKMCRECPDEVRNHVRELLKDKEPSQIKRKRNEDPITSCTQHIVMKK